MPRVPVTNRITVVGRIPAVGRMVIPTQQNLLLNSANIADSSSGFEFNSTAESVVMANPLDGTNTVVLLTEDTETNYHGMGGGLTQLDDPIFSQPIVGRYLTMYMVVKANTRRYAAIDYLLYGFDTWCIFDFESGEVVEMLTAEPEGVATDLSSQVVPMADGWYLVSFTVKANTSPYNFNELGAYVLGAAGALGDSNSIFYEGAEESFYCAGALLAMTNEPIPYTRTTDDIIYDGALRLKIN